MKSILPSPSDLWSSALPDGQEPLAYLVGQIVPASRFQPSPPLPAIWGVLSALSRVSFEPNVWVEKPFPAGRFPALTGILKCARVGRERRHHREWPLALGEFSPALIQPFKTSADETRYDDVDAEWLAAVVLAAGADPWIDKDAHHGLGSAFGMAAGLNLAGLVERMWAVEKNRPSLQQLSEVVCASPVFPDKGERTWLEHALTYDDPALTVWLLRQGVRPLPDRPHPATLACHTGQLDALKEHGCWPSAGSELRSVETAWRNRLKKGELTASQFAAFQAMASPEEHVSAVDQDQKTLAAFFEQRIASPKWNSTGYVVAATNVGIPGMAMEAEILKGPMAGRWNRLAVELFSHLRQGHARGVLAWDVRKWVAPLAPDLPPGSLKSALGVEWRAGVSTDGLLALGLMGMSDIAQRGQCASLYARPLDSQPLIDVAAEALGVSDVKAWAMEHASAAVAWTELATKGGSAPACNRMQDVWATALTRHPFWLVHEPALSLRLLRALGGNFKNITLTTLYDSDPNKQVRMLGRTSSLGTVIDALWPGVSKSPPALAGLSDERRAMAVEIALMVHTEEWLKILKEGFRLLSPEDWERVKVFEAYTHKHFPTKTWDGQLLSNALRELQLDARLPEPGRPQEKPRF